MQLQEVRIRNFRNFDDFTVRLEEFSVIIGANNLGKTNFLEALGYVFAPTSARNVRVTKRDFHNPADPIIIDVVFGNLTETDKAAFFHEEGLINPDANTITIRFESHWSSTEQDVVNECYFVRDDLDSVQRTVDFTRRFKERVPFFAISASRSAAQEVGVSRRKDFGRIMRLFADDYLKPIETLWQDVSDKRREVQDERERWEDYWEDFPEEEFESAHEEIQDLLLLIQNSIIGRNLGDGNDIQNELIAFQERWDEARNSLQEALGQLEGCDTVPMFFGSVEDLLTKVTVLLNRCNAQLALFNLRDGMLSNQHFSRLNTELNSVFGEILPGQDVGLNLFPIQDDELISRVSVDIDDFPLLRHGSGYQSVFVIGVKLMRTLSQLLLSEGIDVRNFILAVEEPEVHLHPHMQRHLVKSLRKFQTLWAERGYALQVICTTHSPSIVSRIRSHQLVIFHRNASGTTSTVKWSEDELDRIVEEFEADPTRRGKRYNQLRNWTEFCLDRYADVFFSNCVIVVEGDTEEGAIPIWASKLTPPVDFDQLGISFVNAEGGSQMGFALKVLDEFGVDHTCLHDRGDDHEVDVSSGGVHATQGGEFEDDVLASVRLSSILRAMELVSSESSNANRLGWIRGHINGCEDFYETQVLIDALDTGTLEQDQEDRLRREMARWIKQPKIKSLAFGRALAQMTSEDEIPEICRAVIEDAANRARDKIGMEHG